MRGRRGSKEMPIIPPTSEIKVLVEYPASLSLGIRDKERKLPFS